MMWMDEDWGRYTLLYSYQNITTVSKSKINEVELTPFLKIFKISNIYSLTEFFRDKQFRTPDSPDRFLDTSLTSKTMGTYKYL